MRCACESSRLRVQRADYVVDPAAVADAMMRHAVSQRRWWNPRSVAAATPAGAQHDRGRARGDARRSRSAPPPTRPPRGRPAPRRRRARSPRPPPRRAPTAGTPSCARDVGDAVGERQRVEVDPQRQTPPARATCPASEARPSERSIIAWAPARASARPAARRGRGRRWRAVSAVGPLGAAVEDREAGAGGAERAGHADEVAGPRAVAPDDARPRRRPSRRRSRRASARAPA